MLIEIDLFFLFSSLPKISYEPAEGRLFFICQMHGWPHSYSQSHPFSKVQHASCFDAFNDVLLFLTFS